MNKFEEYRKLREDLLEVINNQVKPKKCICCGNEVKPLENLNPIHPLKQEMGMWNSGCVEVLSPGYGSGWDSFRFYIAICDSCIEEKSKLGYLEDIRDIRITLEDLGYDSSLF
jgi:hypothetical protein